VKLTPFIKANIDFGSQITTDGWPGYSDLRNEGFVRKTVIQRTTEDKKSVLPDVHLVTSLFKWIISGTFQRCFSPEIPGKLGIGKSLKETVSDRDGWGNLPLRVQGTLSHPKTGYATNALKIKWWIKPGEK